MRFRKLRIAASVFFGVLTLALGTLWIRSYWRLDMVDRSGQSSAVFNSINGYITFLYLPNFISRPGHPKIWRHASAAAEERDLKPSIKREPNGAIQGAVPYWFLLTPFATATVLPWVTRFSLRTLLITTTLVAVVLGLIVWLR